MLRASQPCLRALRSTAPFARLPAPRAQHRHYASVTELSSYPKPGERIHGFTLQRAKHVSELELTALLLQHDKTGAEYLHVAREDSNNVFSIGFKTNPPDDTGVPHILEHTTLCGSERYPIRDPFFKMLPRSLSNFMNAFTSSDHTSYPFATTNRQDFKNLLSVYMDATLHPLLKASDFTQEGWRIGPENPAAALGESSSPEADSKLVFKGVVYNEMKGQMSDASYLFWIRYHDHLIPALNNSGGDPQRITDLTHEQLKKYHADHYHPSNAKIFTYGDMPLLDHLKELGPKLEKFDRIRVDRDIKSPIGFQDGPIHVTVKGPEDPLVPSDAQYKTSTTWLTGDTINIVERFSLSVLSSLLLDGYGSPLYRDLIEAGLGTDFTPNTGFSPTGKEAVFSVGLSGVKQEDVPKVKEAVQKALRETKEKGFEKIKVDGILHQLELSLKHKTANFGMSIMQRLQPDWFNGVDPFDALAWQKTVDAFKERYSREGYLEGLLEKYLLNDRTLTFTMEPSEAYAQELAAEEAERLAKRIKDETKGFASDEEAHKHLAQREIELMNVQEEARDQDLSCLPSVHVNDIPRQKEKKPVRDTKVGGVQVQWRETPTNGLTYFRLLIPQTMQMSNNARKHAPLLCDALLRLGTRRHSTEQLEELIKLKTGGINVAYFSSASPLHLHTLEEGISIAGSALDENVPAMLELVREIILETDFDSPDTEKKIRELLQTSASNSMDAVAESGHAYAKRFVESGLSAAGLAREQTAGLTQVKLITGLASRGPTESLEDVIQALKEIQSRALSKSKMRIAINCGSESVSKTEQALHNFLSSLPSTDNTTITTNASQAFYPRTIKSFFPLPYQVYYSAVAFPTVPYIDPSGAPLQILAQLLTHNHLHHEIREKGGAYGAGAYSQGLEGIFGAYAYRDPNPLQTLKTISEAGAEARDREWKDRQIEEAKLSVFQALDAPESVSQEGMHRFLSGVDDKMLQKRREQLLDVTAEDVKRVAEEFLVQGAKRSNIAVLGAKQAWVDQQSGWEIEDVGVAAQVLQGDSEE